MRHRNVVRARSQRTLTRTIVVAVTLLALGAPAAWAQPNAQLTGRVEDETGGLMPGVGVLADCDCLLTPRETTTGPEGRFNLTALPVGEYTVTFSLSGFSTVVLEGLEARALGRRDDGQRHAGSRWCPRRSRCLASRRRARRSHGQRDPEGRRHHQRARATVSDAGNTRSAANRRPRLHGAREGHAGRESGKYRSPGCRRGLC